MKKNNFAPIEDIIKVAKKGGMFILVDDEKRENEGDLIISSTDTNSKNINFHNIVVDGGMVKNDLFLHSLVIK